MLSIDRSWRSPSARPLGSEPWPLSPIPANASVCRTCRSDPTRAPVLRRFTEENAKPGRFVYSGRCAGVSRSSIRVSAFSQLRLRPRS
jgi:hypothetical protein